MHNASFSFGKNIPNSSSEISPPFPRGGLQGIDINLEVVLPLTSRNSNSDLFSVTIFVNE
mgnify:CR=1 FL=1